MLLAYLLCIFIWYFVQSKNTYWMSLRKARIFNKKFSWRILYEQDINFMLRKCITTSYTRAHNSQHANIYMQFGDHHCRSTNFVWIKTSAFEEHLHFRQTCK